MNRFEKLIGHLRVVCRHKWEVGKVLWKFGMYKQAILHDMSKFSPTEFLPSVKYFTGTRSPIDNEKEDIGYSLAWQHHKGRNPHHWEYWIDNLGPQKVKSKFIPNSDVECDAGEYTEYVSQPIPLEIPYEYVLEMIADWIGAGRAYKSKISTYDYFKQCDQSRLYHPTTHSLLVELLKVLDKDGIDEMVDIVKSTDKDYDCILGYFDIRRGS